MFLRKLDMLSPYITLYFKGERKHSSKFSGLLSIIAYVIVFFIGIYYIYDYIYNKVPQAYFYNRYIEDAGNYPLNSSSLFNYIQIYEKRANIPIHFDFSIIRAIGVETGIYDTYMNNPNMILKINHWLYGYCDDTDIKGIESLIDYENIKFSICIKRYYDIKTKQYYNIGEKEFRWPSLEKGCSHPNRTYYGIILQRCDKVPNFIKSQDIQCKSESEITTQISKYSLKFGIIDNIADIINFDKPLTKYVYEFSNAIVDGIYKVNNLNFNPVKMLTHHGLILDHLITENSYIFYQNEKVTIDSSILSKNQTTNGCLISYFFWMQNNLQFYERINNKIQDILSDIGGIYSIIETIAYIINLLVHNFIIVLDTEDLVINRDSDNFNENNRNKRPAILRRANQIVMNPPKKQNILGKMIYNNEDNDEQSSSSKFRKFNNNSNDNNSINNINNSNNISNINNINNINDCNKSILNNLEKGNTINNNKSKNLEPKTNKGIISQKTSFEIDTDTKTDNKDNSIILNNDNKCNYKILNNDNKENKDININNESIKEKIDEIDNRPIEKQNFTWLNYLRYLIFCRKYNNGISYYENFRSKLISEENIIQSYLDVYKLLDSQKEKIEKND